MQTHERNGEMKEPPRHDNLPRQLFTRDGLMVEAHDLSEGPAPHRLPETAGRSHQPMVIPAHQGDGHDATQQIAAQGSLHRTDV